MTVLLAPAGHERFGRGGIKISRFFCGQMSGGRFYITAFFANGVHGGFIRFPARRVKYALAAGFVRRAQGPENRSPKRRKPGRKFRKKRQEFF
jgi:hypothetical protein